MSTTTADSYPESVGSCRPPTTPTSPSSHPVPAAAPRGAPVRRQLNFANADADDGAGSGAGGDLEDFDDFLIRAVDDIERGYNEAKRRAPPCVCGRGDCALQRNDQSGQWMYICSSQPKCKHVVMCKEVDQNPQSLPTIMSDPKPSNPCAFSIPRTPVADARTQNNNVNFRGAGATTPVNANPQPAFATAPFNYTSKTVGTTTPVHVSRQGAGTTAAFKITPRSARTNDGWPICHCTAGKCKVLKVGNENFYVCPIPKGQGACSYKVPLIDAVNGPSQIGDNNIMEAHGNNAVRVGDNSTEESANPAKPNDDEWPFDIINNEIVLTAQATPGTVVHQKSPSTPHQQIAMVKTPTKTPMTPYGNRSPMTPLSNNTCHGCGEKGHWINVCPKPSSRKGCFHCGMVGHWRANCPQLRRS